LAGRRPRCGVVPPATPTDSGPSEVSSRLRAAQTPAGMLWLRRGSR
jgi:hypothetical protein